MQRLDRERRDAARRARPLDWSDPVQRVDGIGPSTGERLAARGAATVADLVWTLPVGWDDLASAISVPEALAIARAAESSFAPSPRQVVRAVIRSASLVPMRGRRAVRVIVASADGKEVLDAWWFFAAHGVLAAARPGEACLLLGRVTLPAGKRPRMAHPELLPAEGDANSAGIRARYPSLGIPAGTLRRALGDALARTASLPDPVPPAIAQREGMPPAEPLLRAVHGAIAGPPPQDAWRALAERLAWVEAFARVWQRQRAEAETRAATGPGGLQAPALPGTPPAASGSRPPSGSRSPARNDGPSRPSPAICPPRRRCGGC